MCRDAIQEAGIYGQHRHRCDAAVIGNFSAPTAAKTFTKTVGNTLSFLEDIDNWLSLCVGNFRQEDILIC